MKRCKVCGATYDDDFIRFCLNDGTALPADQANESTIAINNVETIRLNTAETGSVPTVAINKPYDGTQNSGKNVGLKFAFAGIGLVFFLVVVAGGAGAAFYFMSRSQDVVTTEPARPDPPPAAQPMPALKDDPQDVLRKQMEDLEKRLAEEFSKLDLDEKPEWDFDTTPGVGKAVVSSPTDGFLALRSMPSDKTGERLAVIPDGTEIVVLGCQPLTRVSGKQGRWCGTIHSGQFGWVFDAWLVFGGAKN